MYSGPLANGDIAVVLTNWALSDYGEFSIDFGNLGATGSFIVRDLWNRVDLGTYQGSFKVASIPAFGSHAFRLRRAPPSAFMQ